MTEVETAERWRVHARWQLGRIGDQEYAKFLEANGDPLDDPMLAMLLEELRKRDRQTSD